MNVGTGTARELSRAVRVAQAIADHYGETTEQMYVNGHEHEELPRGGFSIGWEGSGIDAWAYHWGETAVAAELEAKLNVHFEARLGCILTAYPN